MTLSSPRWSRPRSLELVAGSGTRSGSDDVYDIHGNLSKGRSRAHGADHPITATVRIFYPLVHVFGH